MDQIKVTKALQQFLPGKLFYNTDLIDSAGIKDIFTGYLQKVGNQGHDPSNLLIPQCHDFHQHSCLVPQLLKGIGVVGSFGPLYLVVHVLPVLLYKRKQMRKEPGAVLKKVLRGWLKSLLFAFGIAFVSRRGWCEMSHNGTINMWRLIFYYALASCTLLFEAPSRRGEIAINVFPRYLESIPIYLSKIDMLPRIPKAANLLLGAGMGITSYCYFTDDTCIKSHIRWLVSLIAGDREEDEEEAIELNFEKPSDRSLSASKDQQNPMRFNHQRENSSSICEPYTPYLSARKSSKKQ